MARHRRIDVLNTMYAAGLVPVFYHPDLEVVTNVARACLRGGVRLLEFTNRGDLAWEVFRDLEKHCARELPEMITGVGSVVDAATATLYINNGASFVVGPVLNAEVARACNRRKIPYSPGCGTASEISAAEELGCEIVKIFPGAEVGGPSFVKAVKGGSRRSMRSAKSPTARQRRQTACRSGSPSSARSVPTWSRRGRTWSRPSC